MSTTSHYSEAVRRILLNPTRGIAGLVDELLAVCREQALRLDWEAGRLCIRSQSGDREESIDAPVRQSVFRAILARIAALCNERIPNSVSPYGGRGEISAGENPLTSITVTFCNTPAEQKLELRTATGPVADGAGGNSHEVKIHSQALRAPSTGTN